MLDPDPHPLLREFLAQLPPATAGTVMRSLPIRGFPAYTEWTQESQHGEVHVLVESLAMVALLPESAQHFQVRFV